MEKKNSEKPKPVSHSKNDHDIAPYVVHEAYVEDHRFDGLRAGEGCVVSLSDGSLYHLYGSFEGPGDAARATLMETRSEDGIRWTDPVPRVRTPEGAQNIMSASMLPLSDGGLGIMYLRKNSSEDCVPLFITSDGNARSWSEPVVAMDRPGYYVVNNDRLVQLSSGRLITAYCWYDRLGEAPWNGYCGSVFSDDLGKTWRRGRTELQIEAANIAMPKLVADPPNIALEDVRAGRVVCQEPGVVELLDGRVMMWCRTTGGYAYRSISSDGGDTWSPFVPIPDFAMPCGPQSIKRLPGSKRLIMLFNDRQSVPFGHSQFQWRRPLAVAVSDDDAVTWRRHGLLEPETVPSNCYYTFCFHQDNIVFAYYEGVMRTNPEGFFLPRNLASLKLKVVRRAWFEL